MNQLTGIKDVDREILKHIDDRELLKICSIDRRMWRDVCDDDFLRRRLRYPGIEKYKRENESWKEFYLRVIYITDKMARNYNFIYQTGDFEKQYKLLQKYKPKKMIREAAEAGELDLVKHALKHGADIRDAPYALIDAAENGHLDIVRYLVEQGISPHAASDEALRLARGRGHYRIVEYLRTLS